MYDEAIEWRLTIDSCTGERPAHNTQHLVQRHTGVRRGDKLAQIPGLFSDQISVYFGSRLTRNETNPIPFHIKLLFEPKCTEIVSEIVPDVSHLELI